MGFYDRHILPHVLDCVCGLSPVTGQRRKVVPLARGRNPLGLRWFRAGGAGLGAALSWVHPLGRLER